MEIYSYVTGFIEGEGCFSVSFSLRQKMKLGVEVRPSFSVSQHKRNKNIILLLQEFFGVGGVRYSRHDQNYKYEVRGLDDLLMIIIPHFEKYPLKTTKAYDMKAFKKVCILMKQNKHLSKEGMKNIIQLSSKMNPSGKRKYTPDQLLRTISKMKV